MPDNGFDALQSFSRPLPSNTAVEMALLGALLVDNRVYDRVAEIVTAEHFLLPGHQAIYAAVSRIVERGEQASDAALTHVLALDESVEAMGGARYAAQLAACAMNTIDAESYARTIRSLWISREAILLQQRAVSDLHDQATDEPIEDRIAGITAALDALAVRQDKTGWVAMDNAVTSAIQASQDAFQRGDGLVGVSTGLSAIDEMTGGICPGDIIIIAGRPGMGKTSLADQIAESIARESQRPVAFFSLEMGAPQLGQRWLARKSGTDLGSVRRGQMHSAEFDKLVLVGRSVGKLPLFIDPTPSLSLQSVRSRARLLHRQQGQLGAIVVDHIGLMRKADPRMQRHEHLGEITSGLKALAKELGCPVLALSQLNRGVEGRDDKRPTLGDLRESGRIEEDADAVWLLYREAYYLERSPKTPRDAGFDEWDRAMDRARNLCDVIIAKQRQGPAGTVTLKFDSKITAFSDRVTETGQSNMDYADERGWR